MTPIKAILTVAAALFLTACETHNSGAMAQHDAMGEAGAMADDAGAMADDTMSDDMMMSN